MKKYFIQYLKENLLKIVILFICIIIFCVSFLLYHLPILAVIYPTTICGLILIGIVIYDVRRDYMAHKRRRTIIDNERELLADLLLQSEVLNEDSVLEADYKEIIENLLEEKNEMKFELTKLYEEMIQYYTLWGHQIKTPISSMKLHLENEDSNISRQLSNDLLRIEQYVEMVLTYLRLDANSTDYVLTKFDLFPVVKTSIKRFSGEFIFRRLSLQMEEQHMEVLSDEKWLSFVIEQLLSNALKYTKAGFISISFSNQVLCIKDTGIGIPSDELPRIFEKGYTGSLGRTDKRASGIGLYLCKRICDNLGHKLWIESKIDEGTRVFLDLSSSKQIYE